MSENPSWDFQCLSVTTSLFAFVIWKLIWLVSSARHFKSNNMVLINACVFKTREINFEHWRKHDFPSRTFILCFWISIDSLILRETYYYQLQSSLPSPILCDGHESKYVLLYHIGHLKNIPVYLLRTHPLFVPLGFFRFKTLITFNKE